jgi:CRP-like cAMP-binding protein
MAAPLVHELASVGPFTHLDEASRSVVANWFEVETFDSGEVVVDERDGKAFFVLAAGTARVRLTDEEVAELGPGDYFGEMSLLYGQHRAGTVEATSPVTVWSMFGTRGRLAVPA